jgi:hypothetical protein
MGYLYNPALFTGSRNAFIRSFPQNHAAGVHDGNYEMLLAPGQLEETGACIAALEKNLKESLATIRDAEKALQEGEEEAHAVLQGRVGRDGHGINATNGQV